MQKIIESFKFIILIPPVKRSNIMMIIRKRYFVTITVAVLFFSMPSISYQQLPFLENEQGVECISYEAAENTITIDCDYASFGDLISTIYNRSVLEKLKDGEYLLKANLR